jgi:dGTP triphosphohydrolase
MHALHIKRAVFHSEADFQFALAWELQKEYPSADIRLEYPTEIDGKACHIDILVGIEDELFPIELKYKTMKKIITFNDEKFYLKGQGAQNLGRYDLLKDVMRIETILKDNEKYQKGYVIMLSNDPSYWNAQKNKNTCCAAFSISEGKIATGSLAWAEHASAGTKKGREKSLNLYGNHITNWTDYSKVDDQRNGSFKYLLVNINN